MRYILFLKKFLSKIRIFLKSPHYGFINGHNYIEKSQIQDLKKLVGIENKKIEEMYENLFADIIGDGKSISYASGRMAFFELMRYKKIKKGDEVIILGATCSVMINAILRLMQLIILRY